MKLSAVTILSCLTACTVAAPSPATPDPLGIIKFQWVGIPTFQKLYVGYLKYFVDVVMQLCTTPAELPQGTNRNGECREYKNGEWSLERLSCKAVRADYFYGI